MTVAEAIAWCRDMANEFDEQYYKYGELGDIIETFATIKALTE